VTRNCDECSAVAKLPALERQWGQADDGSGKIERKEFGGINSFDLQRAFFADSGAIPGVKAWFR
jgi:hypothetical protein